MTDILPLFWEDVVVVEVGCHNIFADPNQSNSSANSIKHPNDIQRGNHHTSTLLLHFVRGRALRAGIVRGRGRAFRDYGNKGQEWLQRVVIIIVDRWMLWWWRLLFFCLCWDTVGSSISITTTSIVHRIIRFPGVLRRCYGLRQISGLLEGSFQLRSSLLLSLQLK